MESLPSWLISVSLLDKSQLSGASNEPGTNQVDQPEEIIKYPWPGSEGDRCVGPSLVERRKRMLPPWMLFAEPTATL
jgi:hypothetical protein